MQLSHTAEFVGSYQTPTRISLKSIFRVTMLATAALLCAATLAEAQTVTTIYNFAGNGISGATPWYVTLVQGTNGNLYGTTYNGGKNLSESFDTDLWEI